MIVSAPVLSPEQEQAYAQMSAFLDHPAPARPYFTVHGLAGSGKTTVLSRLARARPQALTCTLTGKAADVLRRKIGCPVDTIHSVFYRLRGERQEDGRKHLEWDPAFDAGDLRRRALLIDECGQLSAPIAHDIIRTGCRIIACGDPGQIKPVSGAQFFTDPDFTLKTIHRQALDSAVLRQAHWVRLGKGYADDGPDFRVVTRTTKAEVLAADAIICWKNKTRLAVNALVREFKGLTAPHPVAGETVMCLKNAKDYGIYNGATYTLLRDMQEGDDSVVIDVDGVPTTVANVTFEGMRSGVEFGEEVTTSFTYGYCLTCHKATGSEWDRVIVIDEYYGEDREHWLYSALTRAAKSVIVVNA